MNRLITLCLLLCAIYAQSQTTKTWTGATGNWEVDANWSPAGVPGPLDSVVITGLVSQVTLNGNANIAGLSVVNRATFNLNGNSLQVTRVANISTGLAAPTKTAVNNGSITAGRFTINNAALTGMQLDFVGGVGSNSTINGTAEFFGATVITNSATGPTGATLSVASTLASNVVFHGPVEFIRNNAINIGGQGTVTFQNNATFNTLTATGVLNFAIQGQVVFNDTVYLNNALGLGNVNFGNSGGTTTFNEPGPLQTSTGYVGATMNINNLTQTGPATNGLFILTTNLVINNATFSGGFSSVSNNLTLTSSSFNGVNNFESNLMAVGSCNFNQAGGATTFTKTPGGQANWPGNNTFHGDLTFIRNADNRVNLANAGGNTYLGDVTFDNTSSINTNFFPFSGAGFTSSFHGNITLLGTTEINLGIGRMEIAGAAGTRTFSAESLLPHIVDTLIMNADSAELELLNGLDVRGQLILSDGIINTAGGIFRILDDATTLGGADSTHVSGPMVKIGNDAYIFPIGDRGFYAPLSISAPLNITDTYAAQYYKQNPSVGGFPPANTGVDIDHVSVKEYWAIAGGLSPLVVTISWDARSGGVTNPIDLRVVQWNGILWADAGNGAWTGTTASGTISTAGTIATGLPVYLTLASNTPLPANPLPIELLSFTARPDGDKVQINWVTATETNNDYFTVERSVDGRIFEAIGQLPGAGTSITPNYYAMTDVTPLKGLSYYRLRQTDFDGSSQVSDIVSIFMENEVVGDIQVFPNPVETGTLQIYAANIPESAPIRLLNAYGQQVATAVVLSQGYWQMDTSRLAPGMYFLYTTANNTGKGYKVVVR